MKDGAWKKVEVTVVTYSRPGPDKDLVERVRCLEKEFAQTNELMKQLNAQMKQMSDDLKAKLMKEEPEDLEKTMMQWQTAQSVFNAYGVFAWSLLSKTEHDNLARFGIRDFATMFYTLKSKSDDPSATAAAQKALGLLPSTIRQYSYTIIAMKSGVSDRRLKHAHTQISEECLEEFLNAIGLGERLLSSLEFSLIRHLRANARKPLTNP